MERNIIQERDFVRECISRPLDSSQKWYTINTRWWDKWKKFVNFNDVAPSVIENECPGAIDNSMLINNGGFNNNSLVEYDYEIIPDKVWLMFTDKYGCMHSDVSIFCRNVIKTDSEYRVELFPIRLSVGIYGENNDSSNIEKEFSCVTYLVEVEKFIQNAFNIPEGAVFQLIQEYDNDSLRVIHCNSEITTLSDIGFKESQNLYVDVRNSEGDFSFKEIRSNYSNTNGSIRGGSSLVAYGPQLPSTNDSSVKVESTSSNIDNHFRPGICGLSNLGNTCFMNSAIQCISNVPPITDYFLTSCWVNDLNKDNPLGMNGRIATAYANLIKEMWSGRTAYALPREFKHEVALFAPQFCGYSQHDSQELMMFLLDGLHEDLNRITNKPYIEQKNCASQPDQVVADENWKYHLQRNDSIIVDYFHGQLKSKVVCPDCNFVSVTFDPFACLSLPLGQTYEQSVVFCPLDPTAPILNLCVNVYRNTTLQRLISIIQTELSHRKQMSKLNDISICQVRSFKILRFLSPTDNLSAIPSDDHIVLYEIESLRPDHYYIDINFKDKSSANNFCLPVLIQLYKRVNWQNFIDAIRPHLPRFLTDNCLKNVVDNLTGENGDKSSDSFDGNYFNEDTTDTSDFEKSESISNSSIESSKIAYNVFENIFSVILLQTTNEHEINPISRTRHLKEDSDQHINLEWTTESKLKKHKEFVKTIYCSGTIPNLNVDDCLRQFLSEECLGQKDLWFCPRCKKDKAACKKLDIWRLPKVLVLHLKRFKATNYFGDKINMEVNFPVRNLDLSCYIPNISKKRQNYVYDLVAVSNHVGCLAGGHYFTYAKNCIDQKWYKFDDSNVSPVDEDDIVTKSAYVLVYVLNKSNGGADYQHFSRRTAEHHRQHLGSEMELDIDSPE